MVGHEVSHALHTPKEDIEDITDRIDPNNPDAVRSYLNVIEDARIEKKIKRKYAGLRKPFHSGYTELMHRDFFGTAVRPLDSFSLIDRINLHFKVGNLIDVPFSPDEYEYVHKVDKVETFDEVFDLAKELYGDALEKAKSETQPEVNYGTQESGDEDFDEDSGNELGFEEDPDGELESVGTQDAGNQNLDDDTEDENAVVQKSETQENFDSSLNELIDDTIPDPCYGNIPNIDSEGYINSVESWTTEWMHKMETDFNTEDWFSYKSMGYEKFRKSNTKVVNYLVKEFELKKNAEQHSRALTAKTGVLDVNKLHSYKFNDDLFKKITTIPDGKNHGLLFFVDWSGSMSGSIDATLKQLLNLVWFCRKINIPFEVFAFSDATSSESKTIKEIYKDKDLILGQMSLIQLVSSTLKTKKFNEACKAIYMLSEAFTDRYWDIDYKMRLASTPLNESIILAHDIIPKFKSANRLEIVNIVFLTDGASNGMDYTWDENMVDSIHKTKHFKTSMYYGGDGWKRSNAVITDPVTRMSYRVGCRTEVTGVLLRSLRDRHGVNVIGFFVGGSSSDLRSVLKSCHDKYDVTDELKKIRKDKYLVVDDHYGYTEFYIIQGGKDLGVGDGKLEVKDDASKRVLVSAFKKHCREKLGNRVILNRFVDLIS